jgi:hypothetical protein
MSAETNPACSRCNDGWICETHPDCGWPHDDCAGPGVCPRLLLLRLRSSRRLQVLINCPDMTADRAAKKPALNSKLLGERHYASLNIPTLRAGKRTRGHISHIYEEVGTHDESPSLTAARHAPVLGQAAAGYPGSATNMRIFKNVPCQLCQLRSRDGPSSARALAMRTSRTDAARGNSRMVVCEGRKEVYGLTLGR